MFKQTASTVYSNKILPHWKLLNSTHLTIIARKAKKIYFRFHTCEREWWYILFKLHLQIPAKSENIMIEKTSCNIEIFRKIFIKISTTTKNEINFLPWKVDSSEWSKNILHGIIKLSFPTMFISVCYKKENYPN